MGIHCAVVFHQGRLIAGIIVEVQRIIPLGQVNDIFAVEGVVGGAGGGGGFLDPQAVGVIFEYNGFRGFAHGLQLPALFPGVQPFPVAGGIADFVVQILLAK